LFAPPSGSFDKTTLSVAEELDMRVIMWSKDTVDWRDKDENIVFKRATNKVGGGDLILMHPTAHTLKALPKILEFYKDNGLRQVIVSENLKETNELL
ncbi:MAG: polysaccharide deacetylase, partial [Clostridia bacterium]